MISQYLILESWKLEVALKNKNQVLQNKLVLIFQLEEIFVSFICCFSEFWGGEVTAFIHHHRMCREGQKPITRFLLVCKEKRADSLSLQMADLLSLRLSFYSMNDDDCDRFIIDCVTDLSHRLALRPAHISLSPSE